MSFLKKFKKNSKKEKSKEEDGEPKDREGVEKPKKAAKNKQKEKNKEKEKQKIEVKDQDWFKQEGELAVDVFQTKDEVVVQAPVAGVKVEDLDVIVEDDTVKIRGERKRLEKVKDDDFFLQECYWGSFSREIILPVEIKGQKAKASMDQGVLTIKIPKIKKKNKKKIKIKEK